MKNLNEMTIAELTALYNSEVDASRQIKKFRTKDQAIARLELLGVMVNTKMVEVKVVEIDGQKCLVCETTVGPVTETIPPTEAGPKVSHVSATRRKPVKEQEKAEEPQPSPEGGFGVLADYYARPIDPTPTQIQSVPKITTITKPAAVDTQTEGYIRVIRGERRKPVKGVVKLCRQLLSDGVDGENVISVLQQQYQVGGYDEKAAKSSAQTILADTKKRQLQTAPSAIVNE